VFIEFRAKVEQRYCRRRLTKYIM